MSGRVSEAKKLGRAVLEGVSTVKGKKSQDLVLKFLSQARPLRAGTERTVASFTLQELTEHVGDLVTHSLGDLEVDFAGWATPADAVMTAAGYHVPEDFLIPRLRALVDSSTLIDESNPMTALLGEDTLGSAKLMLSAEERTQRLTEGLVTAIGQAHANNIDPDELFKPPLIRYTLRYLRARIMHGGYDHGNYSELMRAAIFSKLQLRTPPVHQVYLPEMTKPFSANNGYDSLFGHPDYWVPHQNKATDFPTLLLSGSTTPRGSISKGWTVSNKGKVISQKVSDGIRNRLWSHQVPGPAIARPYPPTVPRGAPGWQPVHNVTIFGFDSPVLVGSAAERLDDAMFRNRFSRSVTITGLDLPDTIKTQVRAIVGSNNVPWDMPRTEFEQLTMAWLDRFLPDKQAELNKMLKMAKLYGFIDNPMGKPEVRLYASHQTARLNDILAELDLLNPGPGTP